MVGQQWVAENLRFEAKNLFARKNEANNQWKKLKAEALAYEIKKLRESADEKYGNCFNGMICQTLDSLENSRIVFPQGIPRLSYAESLVREKLNKRINDEFLENFLFGKIKSAKEKRLENLLKSGSSIFEEPDKAVKFACLMFEISQRKTEETFNNKKFTEVVTRGLNSEEINLVSVLCCINKYDYQGGFGLETNLNAYLENPKLEPIPLIIDELLLVKSMFAFYGIKSALTIYVSDTEYTEVGKFGLVTPVVLANLEQYLANLRSFISTKIAQVQVERISTLTGNNPQYAETKRKVYEKVSKWGDRDFTEKWYQKFERYLERICDSQGKRKVFPKDRLRELSLEMTRKRWAVNAAEGKVLCNLDTNTIFVSTETRERDLYYTLDSSPNTLPPMIYILNSAEGWSRKAAVKDNFDEDNI